MSAPLLHKQPGWFRFPQSSNYEQDRKKREFIDLYIYNLVSNGEVKADGARLPNAARLAT